MHSKKVISTLLSLGLLVSSMTNSFASTQTNSNISSQNTKNTSSVNSYYSYGGPTDVSVANEEKIIEMLIKEGKISKNSTADQTQKALTEYMKNTSKQNQKITKKDKELKSKEAKNVKLNSKQKSSDEVTEINVLALLIEFDDYKHNQIGKEESPMYYEDFNKEHYEKLFFGEEGLKGPNGEDLKSVKQYYEEQSGGTLTINGAVTDWYKAPQKAKHYGESINGVNDVRPKELVKDALDELAKDPSIDLSQFDKEDRYDKDNDGNYNEPDGQIDHLMVIHAGLGEDEGGGALGSDAVWSHRWNIGNDYNIGDTGFTAYDYTTVGENAAIGVISHELGHDLGMPDEYDTNYSSEISEPIGYWSLMSSGSWAGNIPGTEPTGISPYSKAILQSRYGGNFQKQTEIDYKDLNSKGVDVNLNQASKTGEAVKINLPQIGTEVATPSSGEKMYWGGKDLDGKNLKTSMNSNIDLSNTVDPTLKFKTSYDIEEGWDFASVQVREVGTEKWEYIKGNISSDIKTDGIVVEIPQGVGITGNSNGIVDAEFSLKEYIGKNIELKIEYEADFYTYGTGIYVDDISVADGDNIIVSDDVEGKSKFELNGFEANDGKVYSDNYYLVEWRNHDGVDNGLANLNTRNGDTFKYDPGMVVWYVNEFYSENWTGTHPGGGYLSVVDADQSNIPYYMKNSKEIQRMGTNRYQMHDAAFSSKNGSKFSLDIKSKGEDVEAIDKFSSANPKFSDKKDFTNSELPQVGVKLPDLGLELKIQKQAKDNNGATINISKK